MNPVAEKLTGRSEEQSTGRHIDEVITLVDTAAGDASESVWVWQTDAEIESESLALRRDSGQLVPVVRSAAPIQDEDGIVTGTVIVLSDITRLKQTEEEIKAANRELHQFVRSVSHDLQEPLRMISLYSDLILHRLADFDPNCQEFLRYVIGGAERMAALLTDLRAYADIGRPVAASAQETDSELVLNMAIANLTLAIKESGATIVHDQLPSVRVDQAHLLQLFQNLLSNAIKYRRDEALVIRVSVKRTGDHEEFCFADNGMGIPEEYVPRIFDFFQRFHDCNLPGTGMGLALCRRIVERYSGRIWVESTPGKGSIFHVALPASELTKMAAAAEAI